MPSPAGRASFRSLVITHVVAKCTDKLSNKLATPRRHNEDVASDAIMLKMKDLKDKKFEE